jgi:hypothetical protein
MNSGSEPPPPSSRAKPLHSVRLAAPPVPRIVKTANGVKHGSSGSPRGGRGWAQAGGVRACFTGTGQHN